MLAEDKIIKLFFNWMAGCMNYVQRLLLFNQLVYMLTFCLVALERSGTRYGCLAALGQAILAGTLWMFGTPPLTYYLLGAVWGTSTQYALKITGSGSIQLAPDTFFTLLMQLPKWAVVASCMHDTHTLALYTKRTGRKQWYQQNRLPLTQ